MNICRSNKAKIIKRRPVTLRKYVQNIQNLIDECATRPVRRNTNDIGSSMVFYFIEEKNKY